MYLYLSKQLHSPRKTTPIEVLEGRDLKTAGFVPALVPRYDSAHLKQAQWHTKAGMEQIQSPWSLGREGSLDFVDLDSDSNN
jgi:hypothetical protein